MKKIGLILTALVVMVAAIAWATHKENERYYDGTVQTVHNCGEDNCAVTVRYHNGMTHNLETYGIVGPGFKRYYYCWGHPDLSQASCRVQSYRPKGVPLAK